MTRAVNAITFTCAWPAAELWQNSRAHWGQKSRAIKRARWEARTGAMEAGAMKIDLGPVPFAYRVTVTFRPAPKSRADMQNLPATVKAHIDGLADALGVDDRVFIVDWVVAEKGGPGAVEFRVEVVE